MLDNKPGNLTVGIVKISKHADPGHASGHAGWLFSLVEKFDAEAALFNVTLFFNNPDIIGTGRNAIFTPDTFIRVHQNDSIFSFMGSPSGADFHAGRIIAVLALNRQELTTVIWKSSILSLFKVIVGFFLIKTVLIVAGHSTGVTPHTLCLIDHHSVSNHNSDLLWGTV